MSELCEMVFILDRSGSMGGLESDTIGGFNSMIEKQRKDNVKGQVSAALFDQSLEIPFDRIDLKDVPEMTDKIYFVRGCTALYDAVGTMICRVLDHRRHLSGELIPDKTVFVIITDGLENASREFTGSEVRRMIERQKEAGWEFLYLGANIDAAAEAEKIGIMRNRSVQFHADTRGVKKNFETLACAVSELAVEKEMRDDWAEPIREDFRSRRCSH